MTYIDKLENLGAFEDATTRVRVDRRRDVWDEMVAVVRAAEDVMHPPDLHHARYMNALDLAIYALEAAVESAVTLKEEM